jgi:hypothetical protein
MASREPTWRKRIAGEWAGGLVKLIVIVVLFIVLLPKLLQCTAQAPQIFAGMVTKAANSAGDAVSNAAHDAVDAAADKAKDVACGLVGSACAGSPSTTAPPPKNSNCLSLEDAARKGLAQARACTRSKPVEFSGNIYARTVNGQTCHAVDGPFEGEKRYSITPNIDRPGWTRVANYHSHPSDGGAYFSLGDYCNYIAQPTTGFVVATDSYHVGSLFSFGGHDGEVRQFVPNGSQLAGDNIRTCLEPHWAWRDLFLCPGLEASMDTMLQNLRLVTRVTPDLARVEDAPCNYVPKPEVSPEDQAALVDTAHSNNTAKCMVP